MPGRIWLAGVIYYIAYTGSKYDYEASDHAGRSFKTRRSVHYQFRFRVLLSYAGGCSRHIEITLPPTKGNHMKPGT